MSRGTPRRMKMAYRCPATKQYRLPPKGLVARSLFTWCRAPVEEGFSTEYPSFLTPNTTTLLPITPVYRKERKDLSMAVSVLYALLPSR